MEWNEVFVFTDAVEVNTTPPYKNREPHPQVTIMFTFLGMS